MYRTRIKFCGLTREQDVDDAVAAGADAIGLVFYPRSKRFVTPERAAGLRARVPPFVSVTALTVNASLQEMQEILDVVQPDVLQFHGDEDPRSCARYGRPYLRAFRVGAPGMDTPEALLESCLVHSAAAGWLFDSHSEGFGGSGRSFDWSYLSSVARNANARPLVLSGGLHAQKVYQALADVRPYAVDVSSGVEIEPGIKSAEKMRQFANEVRRFDAANSAP